MEVQFPVQRTLVLRYEWLYRDKIWTIAKSKRNKVCDRFKQSMVRIVLKHFNKVSVKLSDTLQCVQKLSHGKLMNARFDVNQDLESFFSHMTEILRKIQGHDRIWYKLTCSKRNNITGTTKRWLSNKSNIFRPLLFQCDQWRLCKNDNRKMWSGLLSKR